MADNKVKFLRGTAAEYEASTKDNDVFYYTTDTKKLYLGENEVGNGIDPEVIQAHIDNQTIHAKVWKGTQEEYNAIDPKEEDTIYIIKDSDNTLADKLIDDTSTTATDKTWSAKKINENDEQIEDSLNAHAGNTDIHVTAAEKAAWNAVNYSNANLLINPDFRINQRGETSYTAAGYTVDGWYTNGGAVDVTENGVELTNSGTSVVRFRQSSEITHAQLAGRDITLSAGVGGTTYSASGKVPETKPANDIQVVALLIADTDVGIYLNYSPTRDMFYTYAYVPAGKSAVLNWVKAEIGSVTTQFVPPNPATELTKCQRYLTVLPSGRYGRAVFVGTNAMQFECDLPVTMRIKPTVVSGTFGTIALNQSSMSQAVTDYTTEILSLKNNLLLLQLSKTNGASDCALFATDKILLSAEL